MKLNRILPRLLLMVLIVAVMIGPLPASAWWSGGGSSGGMTPDTDSGAVLMSGACGENLVYELRDSGNLYISGTGPMYDYESGTAPWSYYASSNATNVYFDSGVTYIGQYAFASCYFVHDVSFPDTLVEIGAYAFLQAAELRSVVLPEGLTTIGTSAFSGCGNPGLDGYDFVSVTLPSTIKTIGNNAFSMCGRLSSINLPDGLESVGSNAFASCFYLTEIVMPDSVTSVGKHAFNSCNRLKTLRLSDNLEVLPQGMFSSSDSSNTSLEEITLPLNLKTIETNALGGDDLKTIHIPGNVEQISGSAFGRFNGTINFSGNAPGFDAETFTYNGSGMTVTVCYPENNDTWDSVVGQNFGGTVTWVAVAHEHTYVDGVCTGCGDVQVIASGECGAEGDNLTWVLTADGKLTISGEGAIGGGSPWGAWTSDIRSVVINDGVTHIGEANFSGHSQLVSVTIPESVTGIDAYAFYECGALTDISIPDSVTSIGVWTFACCDSLQSVKLSAGISRIADSLFHFCSNLTNVTIPNGVTCIEQSAFSYCAALTNISIPDGVTTIEGGAFYNCGSLMSIEIPDSVTEIGMNAFNGCGNLVSAAIGAGVATIGEDAFDACYSLEAFTVDENNTVFSSDDRGVLFNKDQTTLIQAPARLIDDYQIPESVKVIEAYAFYGCYGLTGVTIPGNVDSIGESAFRCCRELTDFTISGSVTSIGDFAFRECVSVQSLTVPEGTVSIGAGAFEDCTKLVSVTLPDSLTEIGYRVFSDCDQLVSVTIPKGVASIGSIMFYKSYSVESVTFEGDAPNLAADTFETVKITAYYPCGNETWTADVMQQYGGTVTWMVDHIPGEAVEENVVAGSCTVDGSHDSVVYCTECGEEISRETVVTAPAPGHDMKYSKCQVCGIYGGTCGAEGGNLNWIMTTDGALTISGTGDMEEFLYYSDAPWPYEVTSAVIEEGVTSISDYAFYNRDEMVSITIPASVTSIGNNVFVDCSSLSDIQLHEDNEHFFLDESGVLFNAAGTTLIKAPVGLSGTYTCPEGVQLIDGGAFYSCLGLTELTLPEGLRTIGEQAFRLNDVDLVIPASVESIGSQAFRGLYGGDVEFLGDAPEIAFEAFNHVHAVVYYPGDNPTWTDEVKRQYCGDLTWVVSGRKVLHHGRCGVDNQLTWIITEDNVLYIYGKGAMLDQKALSGQYKLYDDLIHTVVIEEGVTNVGYKAFTDFWYLEKVILADSVTEICYQAFALCSELTEVQFGSNLATIGKGAFMSTNMTEMTIPDSVTTIGEVAFSSCNDLISLHLGKNVKTIGPRAFVSCYSLEEITIPASVESIGYHAFVDGTELKRIEFLGDAPTFDEGTFYKTTTTAYYPEGNPTWTEDVLQQYGGSVTWVAVAHEHTFEDGVCTGCGAAEEITYDMSVAGANMSLGSELAVNFFVKKVDIDTSKDYYIQVTKTYADGRADVTKTYYFQKGEWMDYNSTYYGVKFNGVAAKEMADKLYVQVFHADGTPASDVWTDSIRDYAMRMFGKGTDEKKTMYVDMLNYGAAAQTEFSYGTDDLANSKLTAEHQAYATQTIAYANNRVEGENYYGTNLNLGSSIALNMYFQNVSQDMYAIATYTDHYGNEKEVRIEGSAFVLNKASTNGYRISINTLAVADVRQLVTCTVYNTDGTVVGTCTDSVEGYIARKANSSALYDAIMRFATSAYNSFH